MHFRRAALVLALSMLCIRGGSADPLSAADEQQARAFVAWLYAQYNSDSDFSPLGAPGPQVFDAAMVAALKENQKLLRGDVGSLDYDPICQCQDPSGMRANIRSLKLTGPATAEALVDLVFAAAQPPESESVRLTLLKESNRWRVHDVHSRQLDSLLMLLRRENKSLRTHK